MDPLHLKIAVVSKAVREGRVTSTALTRLCLERIAALDSKLNAFITLTADSALDEAAEADRALSQGRWYGPLHGIPVALKDLIDVAGVRTTAASRVLANNVASENAPLVSRLRKAGAVILGKTNLHEFAYGGSGVISAYGNSVNPLAPERTTGGSSSGSAVAVASQMCFAAIGTDTAGSIRVPAACCSLVGFKPTWGAVSAEGVIPLSASYDHVGPITRSVADGQLVFEAIADPVDPESVFEDVPIARDQRLVIGVAREFFCDDLDAEVADAFAHTLDKLKQIADIRDVVIPASTDRALSSAEAFAYHRQFLEDQSSLYDERTLARIMSGRDITDEAVRDARTTLDGLRRNNLGVFDYVDAIVTPTMPLIPPLLSDLNNAEQLRPLELRMLRNTRPFNVLGWPTVTLPSVPIAGRLRLGLQVAGHPGRDLNLLEIARRIESCIENLE